MFTRRIGTFHQNCRRTGYTSVLIQLSSAVLYSIFTAINCFISLRWLGNVLQRSVHYLRTMCRHLELNGRNRQKKSQETAQKLKILKEKANGVIVRLYDEMEQSLVNICAEVRKKDARANTSILFPSILFLTNMMGYRFSPCLTPLNL